MIDKPGFHPDIPMDQYQADRLLEITPTLSSGIANLLVTRSPLHAWHAHPRLNPQHRPEEDVTKEMDRGAAIHALLLEGAADRIEVIAANDYRTNDAKAKRDAARLVGKIPLLSADYERVRDTTLGIATQLAKTELAGMMDSGDAEMTAVWQDGDAWCRSRFDWISADRSLIVDLKTTENAEPNAYLRRMLKLGGDVQAAFYVRAVERLTGAAPRFVELVVETEPPYAISLVALDPAWMAFATSKVEAALAIWQDCMAAGVWPAYSPRVCYGQLPAWAQMDWDERQAGEIDFELGGQA